MSFNTDKYIELKNAVWPEVRRQMNRMGATFKQLANEDDSGLLGGFQSKPLPVHYNNEIVGEKETFDYPFSYGDVKIITYKYGTQSDPVTTQIELSQTVEGGLYKEVISKNGPNTIHLVRSFQENDQDVALQTEQIFLNLKKMPKETLYVNEADQAILVGSEEYFKQWLENMKQENAPNPFDARQWRVGPSKA